MIMMNENILNVINAVLAYKNLMICESHLYKDKNFDWYKKTQDYYYSLSLPEGLNKNIMDFERILRLYESNSLEKWNNTIIEELSQFIWKD